MNLTLSIIAGLLAAVFLFAGANKLDPGCPMHAPSPVRLLQSWVTPNPAAGTDPRRVHPRARTSQTSGTMSCCARAAAAKASGLPLAW